LGEDPEVKLIKLAVAHYQFEAIHPFRDGNGRVGRLMISLWLHREAVLTAPMLYLSAYFERYKTAYYDALLSVSTEGTWMKWVKFFLNGVAVQSRDAWRRIQQLARLREEYKGRLSGRRAAVSPQRLVDQLFSIPALSVPGAARSLGVTYAAAKASMEKLINANILDPDPVYFNGTRFYMARELIQLIDAPLDESLRLTNQGVSH
jgi:Fic family protein